MDKDYIIEKYASSSKMKITSLLHDDEAVEYLNSLYPDSMSIKESLYRLKNGINNIPICPTCGKPIHWTKNGYPAHCSNKCTRNDPACVEKYKNTCIEKYGVDNPAKAESTIQKAKQTCVERYGGTLPMHSVNTRNAKYFHQAANGTFNTSKPESATYDLLKEHYKDVVSQYRSSDYQFCCDFYIPSLDLYIECNYHWTHGGHWFDPINDAAELAEWIDKSKTSDFYNNAIEVWTKRDPHKHDIAIKNNINYIVFWNINEFKEWINRQHTIQQS